MCCTWAVWKVCLESRGQYWHIYGWFDPLTILQRVVRWKLRGNTLGCVTALGIPQWALSSCHPKDCNCDLQARAVPCTAHWNSEIATQNNALQPAGAPCWWNLGHVALLSWWDHWLQYQGWDLLLLGFAVQILCFNHPDGAMAVSDAEQ